MFARRTSWNLAANRYSIALQEHRHAGRELLDLTASNPTTVGLQYRANDLLMSLTHREALIYEPQAKGLPVAQEAIAAYYAERATEVSPEDLVLTTSTSEGYSFIFRLLCDPGDTVLLPSPSYPLFDFLADLQDVKLVPYGLVYDHGWQIDFRSVQAAMRRAREQGSTCRAVLVVHPNNPTGSFVKQHEATALDRLCAENGMAVIADEVFLDYRLRADVDASSFAGRTSQPGWKFARSALTFTLSGLSKISGLPQMKVAWLALSGPDPLKRDALSRLEVIADTYLSMNAPVQWAISTLLEERYSLQPQMMTRIRLNLAELDVQLARQSPCGRLAVEGGWYAVLRVPVLGTDEDLAISLLEKTGVLVHPGHFYDFASEGYVVISLITPQSEFLQGVERLLRFVTER